MWHIGANCGIGCMIMADDLTLLIDTALGWLSAGHGVALATVTDTWGSAPRPRGSHLIVRDDGAFEGSVSGGCVEADIFFQAQGVIASGASRHLSYGVSETDAWNANLPCGGSISVLVQPLAESGFPPALLARIKDSRAAGQTLSVATDLTSGISAEGEAGTFVNAYLPPLRLAVVGAVHIAQALIPLAASLGHEVLLIDPRAAFATPERFPGVRIDDRWSDEALRDWRPDPASAVITLSHDPKIDDPALIAALASPAYYVGALGSRKSHAARLVRLAAAGLTPEQLARIHGPVGLAIHAKTPAEIAVSIMAGLVSAWRSPA
jgi:xanthine dehydrogenase accessory factor